MGPGQRRFDRVVGVTNEMVMCLYISIEDTSLNFLSTAPQPISYKRCMYVLLLLLSSHRALLDIASGKSYENTRFSGKPSKA